MWPVINALMLNIKCACNKVNILTFVFKTMSSWLQVIFVYDNKPFESC